jgi:hypothetical protein
MRQIFSMLMLITLLMPSALNAMEQEADTQEYTLTVTTAFQSLSNRAQSEYTLKNNVLTNEQPVTLYAHNYGVTAALIAATTDTTQQAHNLEMEYSISKTINGKDILILPSTKVRLKVPVRGRENIVLKPSILTWNGTKKMALQFIVKSQVNLPPIE